MGKRMIEHWRRVACLIRAGIGSASAHRDASPFKEASARVRDYLAHNELGLALDDCRALSGEIGLGKLSDLFFSQARFEMESYRDGASVEVERQLDLGEVVDWPSFHAVCAQQLEFPSYYGRNQDAWIDLVEEVAKATAGDGRLVLRLSRWCHAQRQAPVVFNAFMECLECINFDRRAARICLDISSHDDSDYL
jgi:hypothetical protein